MAKIEWNSANRPFSAGVDNGVLYLAGQPGVVWNGLTSVNEKADDVVKTDHYIDGFRVVLTQTTEDFDFSISAFAYPMEFEPCTGYDEFYDMQSPKPFGMSYRTGDAETGQIHLVYNATVKPNDHNWETLSDQSGAALFVWDVSTRPVVYPDIAPTAHIIIELGEIYPEVKEALFPILYGSDITNPRLPLFEELYDIFLNDALFIVVDNGDGTWTATGPDEAIQMLDTTTFEITWPSAIVVDSDTYTLTSY